MVEKWVKTVSEEIKQIKIDSSYKKILGTEFEQLAYSTLLATIHAIPKNRQGECSNLERAMQAIHELAPKDHLESTLCAQITALDAQGMRQLSRAEAEGNNLILTEAAVNMAVKLLRLKNETIETLMRYRRNGEQKVVVQHINLNDSSKAIIGDIQVKGGGGSV